MAKWHYYNEKGEKVGPIRGRELIQLAKQGIVTPETLVEDENNRTCRARRVKQLTFAETVVLKPNTLTAEQQAASEENVDFDFAAFLAYEGQMSMRETHHSVIPLDAVMETWEYGDDSGIGTASSALGIVGAMAHTTKTQDSPIVEPEELKFVEATKLKAMESVDTTQQAAHERKRAIYRHRRNLLIILVLIILGLVFGMPDGSRVFGILFTGWLILGIVFAVALIPLERIRN